MPALFLFIMTCCAVFITVAAFSTQSWTQRCHRELEAIRKALENRRPPLN